MKRFIYSSMLLMGICVLVACTGKSSSHPFGGTFFTEEGVRFELKADSTTLIQFNDSLTYEGTWQVCKSADNLEYATIEFAGYPAYYFLKDGNSIVVNGKCAMTYWAEESITQNDIS